MHKFSSFEEADQADDALYASMSDSDRIIEFLLLLQTWRPNNGRVERVAFKYRLGEEAVTTDNRKPVIDTGKKE